MFKQELISLLSKETRLKDEEVLKLKVNCACRFQTLPGFAEKSGQ